MSSRNWRDIPTPQRIHPLPQAASAALIASLLSMRGQSQQVTLDAFFGSVCGADGLQSRITDRGFARARNCLHAPALTALNDFVVQRAEAAGIVQRWRGLRVVAADGSVLMPRCGPAICRARQPVPISDCLLCSCRVRS